jgi:hypothetical protein
MSSFKKLNKADVTTVPYAANKHWSFYFNDGEWPSTLNQDAITDYIGTNKTFIGDVKAGNYYPSLVYSQINHLFYQAYTSSLNTGSLMFNINTYESASQYRPTSSYFNYNINPLLIKQFPTNYLDNIDVIVINQDIYGSKVLPTTFQISSSNSVTANGSPVLIRDDGNGNLYDIAQAQSQYIDLNWETLNYFSTGSTTSPGVTFVGNIFYAHGITVITNPSYSLADLTYPDVCTSYLVTNTSEAPTVYEYTDCISGAKVQVRVVVQTPGRQLSICSTTYPVKISGTGNIKTGAPCVNTDVYWTISFQNEHIIYENEVKCTVKESEFNLSYNPTLVTGSYASGSLRGFATSASFAPYVTTIGLYNDDNELLMVAKLAKPILVSPNTDMTFIVKYDT